MTGGRDRERASRACTPRPADEVSSYVQTARPGSRAPHVWLSEGHSTLDYFGRGFVLLRFGDSPPSSKRIEAAARAASVPFEIVDISSPAAAKLYERKLVLVRPDGTVAWRADAEPEDAVLLVEVVRGEETWQ